MMRYAKNRPANFKSRNIWYPYILGVMKLTSCVAAEVLNLFNMAGSNEVVDVVQDYIVYGFIFEIDEYMINTVTHVNVEEEV